MPVGFHAGHQHVEVGEAVSVRGNDEEQLT